MKVAVTSQGQGLDAPVDVRFGRARYFVVVDAETGEATTVDNAVNLNAAQGAGVQAGQRMVDLGVESVVTGQVGPRAFAVLKEARIPVYLAAEGTVREALEAFKAGRLTSAAQASVGGHWA